MDTVLGLIGLVLFIAGVVGFAALVTFIVIKISPAKDRPKKADPAPGS
jgi:hypothetical protein